MIFASRLRNEKENVYHVNSPANPNPLSFHYSYPDPLKALYELEASLLLLELALMTGRFVVGRLILDCSFICTLPQV